MQYAWNSPIRTTFSTLVPFGNRSVTFARTNNHFIKGQAEYVTIFEI